MAELVIRHCTFRVVRHGGWSWGGDRRGLVERMTRLAPQLIAARLAELFANREGEIAEPVRQTIKLPARALHNDRLMAEAVQWGLASDQTAVSWATETAQLLKETPRSRDQIASSGELSSVTLDVLTAPKGLRDLLLQWRETAQLLNRLCGISEATAELWCDYLINNLRSRTTANKHSAYLIDEACSIRDRIATGFPGLGDGARIMLAVLVELLARSGAEVSLTDLTTVLGILRSDADRLRKQQQTFPVEMASADRAQTDRSVAEPLASPLAATVLPGVPLPKHAIGTEVQLTSVLPFLTLGMLARIGWLDVAAASLEALALPDRGAILAAALAERLVPTAGPSIRAAEARQQTIACFAGLEHAPSPTAYAAWNRVAGDGLGALCGFVADEIVEGHDSEQPLLVTRLGAEFLLFDADGHYPVALVSNPTALLALLDRFGASVLLVTRDAATPALIAALDRREHGYVTDAPPGRGEQAQRLHGYSGLWSCAHDMPDARIASAAAQFERLCEVASSGLARLLPEPTPDALANIASLSAAMGLGLLGWKLWREHEQPSPQLALDRLASLDGTARFTPDAIEIRPAVGRRYLDLKRHGALAEIPGVPWLGGRLIRFSGP